MNDRVGSDRVHAPAPGVEKAAAGVDGDGGAGSGAPGRSCVGEAVVDEVAHEVVHDAVVGEAALVARGDQAHPPQQRQLVARGRERELQAPREVPDRHLVVRDGVHQGQADRVREEPEDLGGLGEHRRPGRPARAAVIFALDDAGQGVLGWVHSC